MPRPRKADQWGGTLDLVCQERVVHVEAVRAARRTMPTGPVLSGLVDLFAALGTPTRLRIVAALNEQVLCVCDLAAAVGQSESAVSHHLRTLRSLGLVRARRDGRRMYYTLDDSHVAALYGQARTHIEHQHEGSGDIGCQLQGGQSRDE